jgi:uroporphyrin-III C-methyltransferase
MGGREAAATAERLLAQGRRPGLPVIAIENCSRPDQRILRLTLADLAQGLNAGPDGAHGPVLVMIGEALSRREHQPADAAPAP